MTVDSLGTLVVKAALVASLVLPFVMCGRDREDQAQVVVSESVKQQGTLHLSPSTELISRAHHSEAVLPRGPQIEVTSVVTSEPAKAMPHSHINPTRGR